MSDPAPIDSNYVTAGGTAFVALLGFFAGIIRNLYSRINQARDYTDAQVKAGDNELWNAINKEKEATRDFREDIIEKVAALPTRDDIKDMETRLIAALKK